MDLPSLRKDAASVRTKLESFSAKHATREGNLNGHIHKLTDQVDELTKKLERAQKERDKSGGSKKEVDAVLKAWKESIDDTKSLISDLSSTSSVNAMHSHFIRVCDELKAADHGDLKRSILDHLRETHRRSVKIPEDYNYGTPWVFTTKRDSTDKYKYETTANIGRSITLNEARLNKCIAYGIKQYMKSTRDRVDGDTSDGSGPPRRGGGGGDTSVTVTGKRPKPGGPSSKDMTAYVNSVFGTQSDKPALLFEGEDYNLLYAAIDDVTMKPMELDGRHREILKELVLGPSQAKVVHTIISGVDTMRYEKYQKHRIGSCVDPIEDDADYKKIGFSGLYTLIRRLDPRFPIIEHGGVENTNPLLKRKLVVALYMYFYVFSVKTEWIINDVPRTVGDGYEDSHDKSASGRSSDEESRGSSVDTEGESDGPSDEMSGPD